MLVVGRRLIPMVAALHRPYRQPRTVPPRGAGDRARRRRGVGLPLRRQPRARRVLCRHDPLAKASSRHRAAQETPAAARRLRGAVLRRRRHAVRSRRCSSRDPLPVLATLFIILIGKTVVGYFLDRRLPPAGRRRRSPSRPASRRSANSPSSSRPSASTLGILPAGGARPDPRRRDHLDHPQPADVLARRALPPAARGALPAARSRRAEAPAGARIEPDLAAPACRAKPLPCRRRRKTSTPTALTGHTILVGYGRVGTVIGEGLIAARHAVRPHRGCRGPRRRGPRAGHRGHRGQCRDAARAGARQRRGRDDDDHRHPQRLRGRARRPSRAASTIPTIRIVARAHSDEEEDHLQPPRRRRGDHGRARDRPRHARAAPRSAQPTPSPTASSTIDAPITTAVPNPAARRAARRPSSPVEAAARPAKILDEDDRCPRDDRGSTDDDAEDADRGRGQPRTSAPSMARRPPSSKPRSRPRNEPRPLEPTLEALERTEAATEPTAPKVPSSPRSREAATRRRSPFSPEDPAAGSRGSTEPNAPLAFRAAKVPVRRRALVGYSSPRSTPTMISQKAKYALRALVALCRARHGEPLMISRDLARTRRSPRSSSSRSCWS